MVEAMHSQMLQTTKAFVQKILFILMSCDEVTTIDNQSWLSIHLYVIDGWKWVPILFNLQRVLDGATSTNLTKFIMQNLVEFGSMIEIDLANKLVCFGADGMIVFQGLKNGVTTKLMQNHAPFVSGVHCMAHCTNLAVQTLNNFSLVGKIEIFFASMHNYFAHNPKRHLEANKLAELFECKGNNCQKHQDTLDLNVITFQKNA
jgi:hypothetical protein